MEHLARAKQPESPTAWPHNQSYVNTCGQCKEPFFGPKAAPSCWQCAAGGTRQWWMDKHTDEEG